MKRLCSIIAAAGWFVLGTAAYAISSTPTTITYLDASGNQRIYSFASGNNSHLVVNYWDGFHWHWADQGLPAGTTAIYSPNAITYLDGSGNQRIYVFATASNSHLVVNYWDGSAWHWADQGVAPGPIGVSGPSAVTYVDGSGNRRIYVFAVATNSPVANSDHLVVNYWDGFAWHWADQGLPAGNTYVFDPSAITYFDGSTQRLYVFAIGDNNHLEVNYWDGAAWHWADQGLPAGMSGIAVPPMAITYMDGAGHQRIYAFCVGSNLHLVVNYWDGFSWHWADQGLPAGASWVAGPNAVTYVDATGNQRIYVFAEGSNNHLVVNYWNGSGWHWADQGLPAGTTALYYPNSITYVDAAGNRRIYAFADANTDHLVVNYWNGFDWAWADQGTL
jgi:hypothetical protein